MAASASKKSISLTISFLKEAKGKYQQCSQSAAFPPQFRSVIAKAMDQYPFAADTLHAIEPQTDEEVGQSTILTIRECEKSARSFHHVVDSCVATDGSSSTNYSRYVDAIKHWDAKPVESLMIEILSSLQKLVNLNSHKVSTMKVQELEEAMEALKSEGSSIPNLKMEKSSHSYIQWGSGYQNINNGGGNLNINAASSGQYIATTQTFGGEKWKAPE